METLRFSCPNCSAALNAPANAAGKQLPCPKCKQAVIVPSPEPLVELSEAPIDPLGVSDDPLQLPIDDNPLQPAASPTTAPATKQCPYCLQHVPAAALKCKHCGEFVEQGAAAPQGLGPAKAKPVNNDELTPAEYLVAVFGAPIGLVIGLVWMTQRLKKSNQMLKISGLMSLLIIAGSAIAYNLMPDQTPYYEEVDDQMFYSGEEFYVQPPPQPTPPPQITKPPKEEDLAKQPAEVQRALRANVRLDVESQGRSALGSGVIMRIDESTAYVLTNRHVVDLLYATSAQLGGNPQATELNLLPPIVVSYVDGAREPGKVIWVADDLVDLAIVRAACPSTRIAAADWDAKVEITQGEAVLAIGNPAGLGWTLTRGAVSALRTNSIQSRDVPVIQTDATINPGNSGGGLYNTRGQLIGINNFIINPQLARNTGFALNISLLEELDPESIRQTKTE